MWLWIKRWRDWAMNELWPFNRINPQPQALHYSYEKAGLTVSNQPIPWSAEMVVVEARLRLPSSSPGRRPADFFIRVAGRNPVPAESLRRLENDPHHLLYFRIAPPGVTTTAEVLYQKHLLGQLTLPFLGQEEFLESLRLQMPTLFVRLGEQSVACQSFVASQCKGLIASGVLTSPTSLVPLLDLDLRLEWRQEPEGPIQRVPAQLSSSQLAGRSALVLVVPQKFPRRLGSWAFSWSLAGRPLARGRIRALGARAFQRSLRIVDSRFIGQEAQGTVSILRHPPKENEAVRFGPCFLVSSREPGIAGLCPLEVRARVRGAVQAPLLMEQEILITDGPTVFAPGMLPIADLDQVTSFDLCLKGQSLGALGLCPTPSATFTNEGGFTPPQDFIWTATTEEELKARLNRLFDSGKERP
jgi:hypothetical protein